MTTTFYRGVLPDKDIIKVTDTEVTFRYLDSQTNTHQTRTQSVLKFLWLILLHVQPKGMQRVRDYGFLRENPKQTRVRIQLLLLALFYCTPLKEQPVRRACPCCDHEMACVGVNDRASRKATRIRIMFATLLIGNTQ
ncbi:transposase [Vibrio cholerae]|nr:transposase [Vibrio cholerae]